MGRRLKILDPYAELCSLIERWVRHSLAEATAGLGYPRSAAGFGEATQRQSGYVDPTGHSLWDHQSVAKALDALASADGDMFAAVKMYYMPWTTQEMMRQGYPFAPDKTYYNRLERAHRWLQEEWRSQLATLKAA